jgi:hypothetical protein
MVSTAHLRGSYFSYLLIVGIDIQPESRTNPRSFMPAANPSIPLRPFGKTGVQISALGLGGQQAPYFFFLAAGGMIGVGTS